MRVRVYRNLTKGGYSVVGMKPGAFYMNVIDRVDSIVLRDVKFVVRAAGAKKAKATGVRNVHAFVDGYRTTSKDVNFKTLFPITYEVFGSNKFVNKITRDPLDRAAIVCITPTGIFTSL